MVGVAAIQGNVGAQILTVDPSEIPQTLRKRGEEVAESPIAVCRPEVLARK
jgi:hypothetical protein